MPTNFRLGKDHLSVSSTMSHDDETQLLPQLDPFLRACNGRNDVADVSCTNPGCGQGRYAPAAVILTVSTGARFVLRHHQTRSEHRPTTESDQGLARELHSHARRVSDGASIAFRSQWSVRRRTVQPADWFFVYWRTVCLARSLRLWGSWL
jgi:hypothetical protein